MDFDTLDVHPCYITQPHPPTHSLVLDLLYFLPPFFSFSFLFFSPLDMRPLEYTTRLKSMDVWKQGPLTALHNILQ